MDTYYDGAYFETSRFGHCGRCMNWIVPGDFLTYDENRIEVHYECPEDELGPQRGIERELLARASALLRSDSLNGNAFMLAIADFLDDVSEDARHDDAPAYLTRALQIARAYLGGAA